MPFSPSENKTTLSGPNPLINSAAKLVVLVFLACSRKFFCVNWGSNPGPVSFPFNSGCQGDQIGQIVAKWVVAYFGQIFENYRSSPRFWAISPLIIDYALILTKNGLSNVLGIFSQADLVTLAAATDKCVFIQLRKCVKSFVSHFTRQRHDAIFDYLVTNIPF
jgi:hypothetical protein